MDVGILQKFCGIPIILHVTFSSFHKLLFQTMHHRSSIDMAHEADE